MSVEKYIQGFEPSAVHRVVNQAHYSEGGTHGKGGYHHPQPGYTKPRVNHLQIPRATWAFLLTPAIMGKGF